MSDLYLETCTALNGKKYKEHTSFGFDFLSRHKSQCRQKLKEGLYSINTFDVKEDGKFYNICKICKYRINSASYHFPEDEIPK